MQATVVRAVGLCKAFRTGAIASPVLRGVDLSVSRGECLFLVGPSGSGKTTLLSILGCILSPDSGALEILGDDVTRFSTTSQARFRREKIGFVFQRFHLFDALTAVENVQVAFDLMNQKAGRSRLRALELLSQVGLAEKASSPPKRLSSVVLPLPDGPASATTSPRSTSRSTPRSAGTGTLPRR